MERTKMKRIILALIILLTPVISLIPITGSNNLVSAWVTGYNDRICFVVNGSNDSVLTNYQIKLTINNSNGVSTGSTVYLNGSSLNWPNDIRFTNVSDSNLDYWIESNTSTSAVIWVELDSLPSGSANSSTFYIYSGNASSVSASNGSNTFIFFDHFDNGSTLDTSKWSGDTTKAAVGSSIMTFTSTGTTTWWYMYGNTTTANNVRGRMKADLNGTDFNVVGIGSAAKEYWNEVGAGHDSTKTNHSSWATSDNDSFTAMSTTAIGFDAYHIFDFGRLLTGTDTARSFYENDSVGADVTTDVGTAAYTIRVRAYATSHLHIDWCFLSNYTYNEPVIYSWCAKESICGTYLTTSSDTHGNVTTPGEGTYAESCNISVPIVATADSCYHFVNWTGNTANIANVSAASTTINMTTTNKTAIANFAINTSTITYVAGTNGTLTGTAIQTLNCGATTTAVTAVPNSCYYFVNWSDSSTTNPRTDVATSTNQTFTANFAATLYGAPTMVTSYAGGDSATISWSKGTNTSQTYIRWKIGAYSTSITDGNIISNQSGYTYTHTGLSAGITYYYTLWGLNGTCFSSAYAQTMVTTTSSGGAAVIPNPLPTANTSGWFNEPNASALENNPLYPAINQMADGIGMPHKTWWILLTVGFMVVAGIIVFVKTDNFLLAVLVSVAICVVASVKIFLLPIWFAIVMVLITVGFAWKEIR